jgi:Ala-tRNA(Pro) deacylase
MSETTPPPDTEADVLAFLASHDIGWTMHRHPPLFTVDDSQALRGDLPGAHCKNMFLKNKAGELVLVTCLEDRKIRIRDLEKVIGVKKLSFAKPDVLLEYLGVTPGAVTPLATFHDRERQAVRVILDAQMMQADILNCHPLHNAATVAISIADMRRFFTVTGHAPEEVDFDALEEQARAVSG